MNSDIQSAMEVARSRQMAERERRGRGGASGSGADKDASSSSGGGASAPPPPQSAATSSSKQCQQQKWQKQQQQQQQQKHLELSNSGSSSKGFDLQEIMARRRRLTDAEEVAEPSSSLTISPETTAKPSAVPDGALHNEPPMSPDLKAIMERRRRMSEVGGVSSSSSLVSASEGGSKAPLTVQIPPYSPAAAKSASTVRADLKSFGVDPGLKAAMQRRRSLVEGATGAETATATQAAAKRGPSAPSLTVGPPQRQSKSSRSNVLGGALASSSSHHSSSSSRRRQVAGGEQASARPAPPRSTQSSRSDDAVMMADDGGDDDKESSSSADDLELVLDSNTEDAVHLASSDEDKEGHYSPDGPSSLRRPGPTPSFPSSSLDETEREDPSLSSSRGELLSSPSSTASPSNPQSLRRPGPQPQFLKSASVEQDKHFMIDELTVVELVEEDEDSTNDLELVGTASASLAAAPSAEEKRKAHSSRKKQQPNQRVPSSSLRHRVSKEDELEQLDALVTMTSVGSTLSERSSAAVGPGGGGESSSTRKEPSSRNQRPGGGGGGTLPGVEKLEKVKRSTSGGTGRDARSLEKLDKVKRATSSGASAEGGEDISLEVRSVSSAGAEHSKKSEPSSQRRRQTRRSSAIASSSSGDDSGAGTGAGGAAEITSLESLHRTSRRKGTTSKDSDDFSRAESVTSSRSGSSRKSGGTAPSGSCTARRSGGRRSKSGELEHASRTSKPEGSQSKSTGDLLEEELQQQEQQQQPTRDRTRRAIASSGKSSSSRSFDSSDDSTTQLPPKPRHPHKGESVSAASPIAAGHEGESTTATSTAIPASAVASADSVGFGDADPWGTAAPAIAPADSGGFGAADAWGGGGSAGWGGLTSFPSSGGGAETSGASSNDFSGFPSVGGSFGESGAFPSATTKAKTQKSSAFHAPVFDFGADEGFGGGEFGFSSFGAETQASKVTVWDTSPLVDVPVRPSYGELSLVSRTMFTTSMIGAPVTNPLNGNIIFCSSGHNGATIHEIDPRRDNLQVGSTPIMSSELQRRVAAKCHVSVSSLENVMSLTAGLHYVHGQARMRVAALLDLKVIENPQLMRVVAVWQWGYSLNPFSLQFAMTPPSGGEFTYEARLLQVADGLVFIGGHSPKGPCIFMCKPTVRETWSANFLGGSARITCMSVTPHAKREYPYLAVALSDRSVSIWTYKGDLGGVASKANEPSKRMLFPLCRLEALASLMEAEATSLGSDSSGSDAKDTGFCTQLTWLPPQPSMSSLLLIAASFQNGLAVFHVGLPVAVDPAKGEFRPLPEPSQSTALSQTPSIAPLSVKRWQGRHDRSFVSWLMLGAHTNPCIAILLHTAQADGGSAHMVLGSLRLPLYRRGLAPKERLLPFDVLACSTIPTESDPFPSGLLQTSGLRHLVSFAGRKIISFAPSRSFAQSDASVSLLGHPISSGPPGLTSLGEAFLADTASDKDGILHIFSVTQCERQKSEANPNMHEWSRPRRRHWLCRTFVGDTKETSIAEEVKEDRGFGGDTVKGGASSDVVCELFEESLEGLVPFRIVRCHGASVCAVLCRPAPSTKSGALQGFSLDASHIAIVDYSGSGSSIHVIEGRDVAFWPREGVEGPRGVALSADGSTLTSFVWDPSRRSCKMGSSSRPIVGVDTDVNYVECRRVFCFSGASMLGLVVVGTRHRDGKWCLLSGELCPVSSVSSEKWSSLLPNIVSASTLWLDDGEEVFSVVGLEYDDSGYRNFALATSTRVLIASSGMEVAASVTTKLSGSALAPLGSFAVAFCDRDKIRYLSCLDAKYASGAIATLPVAQCGGSYVMLAAVRPDRILLFSTHDGARLVEHGQNPNTFLLPTAVTSPALLLEPMVANAICVGGKQDVSTPVLRAVIEKFGRKLSSIMHGDEEGIGNIGAGLTPRTLEILEKYGLNEAASWLLTGTVLFDRSANTRILPPWLPIAPKAKGALNSDAFLHVISNGDQYFSEYTKSPDAHMPPSLPSSSGPIAYICREYAADAIRDGRPYDALKTLDMAGSEASDSLILELALVLGKDRSKNVTQMLKSLCGYDDSGFSRSSAPVKPSASLAALAVSLKQGVESGVYGMNKDQVDRWMKPLAPSFQRGSRITRPRQVLLRKSDLASAGEHVDVQSDPVWVSACNESKHVWNEGPRKEKNNLLMLDSIEEWLGRKRPVILGKEGASAARDRGEKTLADILNKEEDDSFGGKSDLASEKDGWVDGVGEGRSDEANLSAYFRMSEGEDEDSPWRSEGFEDLSPYQNRAKVVGDAQSYSLQPTSSSVDEGESGKAKMLYDLVFEKSGDGVASGLAISAQRGGSLDVGVLHQPQKSTRHKCSIEFWFYLPSSENVPSELVLARRTMGPHADDLSKVCLAVDKESVLWELVVHPKGQLAFQTCAGARLLSTQNYKPPAKTTTAAQDEDSDDEKKERADLARFGRWNHVCIVITQQRDSCTKCSVTLYMKGTEVASSILMMRPRDLDEDDLDSDSDLEKLIKKSFVVFGLNHGAGFRLTELRIWACERSADDIQSLLYEYLTAAEAKKKFKVKISNKKGGVNFGKGLAAPKSATTLAPLGGKTGGRSMLAPTRTGGLAPSKGFSLAPKQHATAGKATLAPAEKPADEKLKPTHLSRPSEPSLTPELREKTETTASFEAAFGGFGEQGFGESRFHNAGGALENVAEEVQGEEEEGEYEDVPTTLWDTAVPLSQQVRLSAAAALIRGPPATRHFGGNRGGLPDFSGMDRFGVGGIAICGSEKTIVWRDNEDPPALTYPIGASGAVVSDLMDDEGSEFLCCFLAKEKRMVVFELQSRTVVVELQMTTKLNFWRFLPPEAAKNTLCFMLVTPVGGFHWMPLEESPRPHQVWKRGPELQGKKVVSYEEGGSNGLDGQEIVSRVGLVMVTKASGGGALEAWIIPVDGDSQAGQVSDDVLGACLCQPPFVEDGPFLPLLMTVHHLDEGIYVNVLSVTEPKKGTVQLGDIEVTRIIEDTEFENDNFEPPDLAMGSFPEAICCSLGNIVVVIIRRKGLIAAFELEEDDLSLIALESVGHYVVDAVLRYSAEVGGAEIVMLLSDEENPKDGRMVSFCFRSSV